MERQFLYVQKNVWIKIPGKRLGAKSTQLTCTSAEYILNVRKWWEETLVTLKKR